MVTKKTTITFPISVLKAMRTYMTQENLSLHDQSNVVVSALTEFLEKRGITVEKSNELIAFEVENEEYVKKIETE